MAHLLSNISLRPAVAADQRSITKLIMQNQLNGFGIGWQNFTVAVDDSNQFVGCGQIKQHGDVHELASLAVVDEWQGLGVSNSLMGDLLERGTRPLWLMCESPLKSYYAKYGFSEIAAPEKLPSYFRNMYWTTRLALGLVFWVRGTYVAFMVLDAKNTV
jgi:N-acetylglutamate synthase-like GNAT family acetyltransferase